MISYDTSWGPVIARRAGTHFNMECDQVVARIDDRGKPMGGVIYQTYTDESISTHIASWVPNWLNRELLFHMFAYPFLQLGVQRIFAAIPEDNVESLKFTSHLGFKVVAVVPKVYRGGVDCVVICMERDECRFIKGYSARLAA
jgi:L-amino acid N-acyltransferase YncA